MNWKNQTVLKRIVALLLALADLADRTSVASRPVRALALAILRRTEAIAQTLVIGMARDLGCAMPLQASVDGDSSDDAAQLAHRLRVLALALADLSALAEYSVSLGTGRMAPKIDVLRKLRRLAACHDRGAPAPDTS